VSATEAPPAEAPEQRRCPRCGAALTSEQEWCLECGAAVGTVVASPSGWRGPVALVAVLLTIAAAALILALVELAGDPEQVTEQQPAAQTPPAATPQPTATVAPEATAAPTVDPSTAGVATWPAGQTGWTVVLEASGTEEAATTRAQELAAQGISVGMLDSDDYGSLEPGRFVVFSGQYDSRRAADQALNDLESQVEGAYVRRVAPEPDAGASTESPAP
jgi:septal ring-binding cell division protein DamX